MALTPKQLGFHDMTVEERKLVMEKMINHDIFNKTFNKPQKEHEIGWSWYDFYGNVPHPYDEQTFSEELDDIMYGLGWRLVNIYENFPPVYHYKKN